MRTIRDGLLILVGLSILGGCGGRASSSRNPFDIQRLTYVRQTDEPQVVEVALPVAIDVESFGGDVVINVDEELEVATITVRRVAMHGPTRQEEAEASLADIGYRAEVVPGQLGQVLRVRLWTTHGEPHFQRADLRIDVPAVDGVFVRTERGDVVAINIEGVVDIANRRGDVRIMTNLAMRRKVTIINREGDIEYRVRGESTGIFDCIAAGGRVNHHVSYGKFVIAPNRRKGRLQAALNNGSNAITLRTEDGNISIAVVADPTDIGSFIFP